MPYKDKQQQKHYQEQYKKHKPKSAITGGYYKFYKFVDTLTNEELMVLYKKRMTDCKYATESEKQRLKTEMKIITDLYTLRQNHQDSQ